MLIPDKKINIADPHPRTFHLVCTIPILNYLIVSTLSMSSNGADVVIHAIRVSRVPHPYGLFLSSFVSCAVDRERAAQHLMSRCSTVEGGAIDKATVDMFLTDWQELVGLCESIDVLLYTCQ